MKFDYLFESSWEVCNKVGGIYTVLTSKSKILGDIASKEGFKNYYLGPYFSNGESNTDFVNEEVPVFFKSVFEDLKQDGIYCYFGSWVNANNSKVILIDFKNLFSIKDKIKTDLWNSHKVDSLFSGYEFDEPVMWSTAVGMFLRKFEVQNSSAIILAQFHEWMSGAGILYLRSQTVPSKIKTIFTTHATILGRTLSSNFCNLTEEMSLINPEYEAKRYYINDKHTCEVACAREADVFTTVSNITAIEAKFLLGRNPDVILPNGIDLNYFGSRDMILDRSYKVREFIRNFIADQFFPYYTFDLNNTSFIFTSGRYEYHDKGVDVFVKSLAKLNSELKKEKSSKNIFALFLMPAGNSGLKKEIIDNVGKGGFEKREGGPLVCTHNLNNEYNDPLISAFRETGLANQKDDPVKVLFIPIYLNEKDNFFDFSYYDFILGLDLGVFPSFYEPWGYTPLECLALGIPAITTNLSGFGIYVNQNIDHKKIGKKGVCVLNRVKDEVKIVDDLSSEIFGFINHCKEFKSDCCAVSLEVAKHCEWTKFIENYLIAFKLALKK